MNGRSPYEHICGTGTLEPDRFTDRRTRPQKVDEKMVALVTVKTAYRARATAPASRTWVFARLRQKDRFRAPFHRVGNSGLPIVSGKK